MNNQQRFRSHRLRESYRSDNLKLEDYEDEIHEELNFQNNDLIVIESDEEVVPLQVESESDEPPQQRVPKVQASDLEESESEPRNKENDLLQSKQEVFAEIQAQVSLFINKKKFQQKLMKNHESEQPPIEEDEELPIISYSDYKIHVWKEIEQQKLDKANQKMQLHQTLLQEEKNQKDKQYQYPIEKEQQINGNSESKIVSELTKKNKPKRGRKKHESRSPQRKSRSPRRKSKSPQRKSRSPQRKSRSPRRKSRSPQRKSRSPQRKSRSPQRKSKSPRRKSKSPQRKPKSNHKPKLKTEQDLFLEEMLNLFNSQAPEMIDMLNYDVLLKNNKIMKQALKKQPRNRDNFYFTHLDLEDYPKKKRKSNQSQIQGKSDHYKSKHPEEIYGKNGTHHNKKYPRLDFTIKPIENDEANQDRQIKNLQTQHVELLFGKRINSQGDTEYLCNFTRTRKQWVLQSFLLNDYQEMMLNFENNLKQIQLETRVSYGIEKIKEYDSYCLLSHKISSSNKHIPRIIYLKQKQSLEQEEIVRHDLVKEQLQVAQMFQVDRGCGAGINNYKKAKNKKRVENDEEANFFSNQFNQMKQRNIMDQRKQKFIDELKMRGQHIPRKMNDEDLFEEEIRMIVREQEGQLNIQEESQRLSKSLQQSFHKRLHREF